MSESKRIFSFLITSGVQAKVRNLFQLPGYRHHRVQAVLRAKVTLAIIPANHHQVKDGMKAKLMEKTQLSLPLLNVSN